MASTNNNNFTFFTITQPFLGAPLQFSPPLGSQELEQLVDSYVIGSATKQDKMSEVTFDFYTNATVDVNTGSLFKRYDVVPFQSQWAGQSFEQSPTQSQSSGFSPPIYTPSPASSTTFADSGYGSISMTPPIRNQGGRVSKKAKKDTKKVAEARLPGFSIMTKDGIDVTSSAGRGTKTKEQREHAHLMRIMKACEACKKKKIRCDPSHRRQSTEMSRSSTSSTKPSSSSRVAPSPTVSVPSLTHESTFASQSTTPSFDASNAIDDFVLFPEGPSSAWNPADLALAEDTDLSNFNFDIDIGLSHYPQSNSYNPSFDYPMFDQQHSNLQTPPQLSYEPFMPEFEMDQWGGNSGFEPVTHSRPHPTILAQNSGEFDESWVLEPANRSKPLLTGFAQDSEQNPNQLLSRPSSFTRTEVLMSTHDSPTVGISWPPSESPTVAEAFGMTEEDPGTGRPRLVQLLTSRETPSTSEVRVSDSRAGQSSTRAATLRTIEQQNADGTLQPEFVQSLAREQTPLTVQTATTVDALKATSMGAPSHHPVQVSVLEATSSEVIGQFSVETVHTSSLHGGMSSMLPVLFAICLLSWVSVLASWTTNVGLLKIALACVMVSPTPSALLQAVTGPRVSLIVTTILSMLNGSMESCTTSSLGAGSRRTNPTITSRQEERELSQDRSESCSWLLGMMNELTAVAV